MLAGGAGLAALPLLENNALAAQVPAAKVPQGAVVLVAEIQAKAGEEQAVKDALTAMVAPTRKEKGCLCYNLHESKNDKTVFMFYEQWASQAALEAHGKTEHMKAMQEALSGKVEKGGATFYTMLG